MATQLPTAPQPQATNATTLDPMQRRYFDRIVSQAVRFLTVPENAYQVVRRAKGGDPVAAIAESVAPLIESIYHMGSAGLQRTQRPDIDIVTLLAAGIEVTAFAAKLLERAGIIQETDIPRIAADAAKRMVDEHNAKLSQGAAPPAGMAGMPPPRGAMPPAPAPQMMQ